MKYLVRIFATMYQQTSLAAYRISFALHKTLDFVALEVCILVLQARNALRYGICCSSVRFFKSESAYPLLAASVPLARRRRKMKAHLSSNIERVSLSLVPFLKRPKS